MIPTTRTFGNADGLPPVVEYPNSATLPGVSGTSIANPSIAITRNPHANAPRVSS
ncbi:hypothetical protein [Actinospica robiniae]|uniref:hypothetical protein n=1 Tax=Actinospica robiniae TaxID=304901 RepID=UPI001FE09AEA|nr:hypothetical protein [Actinospica robiniae]